MGGPRLNGKVLRREGGKIFVEIFNANKWLSSENYDITFETNRGVYQLQHNALNFIKLHRLFDILINHRNYHSQKDDFSPCLSNSLFGVSNSNEFNQEQIQAINCIVEGAYHPMPYLLYGPPG